MRCYYCKCAGSIKSLLTTRNIARPRSKHPLNRVCTWTLLIHLFNMCTQVVMETGRGKLAWTNYQVLSVPKTNPTRCSLMQLDAVTGITIQKCTLLPSLVLITEGLKHQLRVHLADGLNCPVLGDKKFGKPLLRQNRSLRRRASTVRSLLDQDHLYLHAKWLEIPGYHGDDNHPLVIQAPLPEYYNTAIRLLQLTTT